MSEKVTFPGPDGVSVRGTLTLPTGTGRAPAIVLVHEWWGLNAHIDSLATRLAAEGFLVVAPDLYHGVSTADPAEASRLMNALDTHAAVAEIGAAASFVRAHERATGKVGIAGFCLGGALAFASACQVRGLSAVVPFYGIPMPEKVDYSGVEAPILAHFAIKDGWITQEKVRSLEDTLKELGKDIRFESYAADHAFVNDTRKELYDPENAKLAWERTVAFFHHHMD